MGLKFNRLKESIYRFESNKWFIGITRFFIVLTTLAAFLPLKPYLPGNGLDNSWRWGMNEAVAQKMEFGREILFTFGPYASIYTRVYHPGTDDLMLYGSLFLAISFATLTLLLFRSARLVWHWAFIIFLCLDLYSYGGLLYLYPLLLLVFVYRLTLTQWTQPMLRNSQLLYAYLFFPLGLLGLIKANFIILAFGVTLLAAGMLWVRNLKKLSLAVLLVLPVSTAVFWLIAGQSLGALPDYLVGTLPMISGYSEGMAYPGPTLEIVLYGGATGVVLLLCLGAKNVSGLSKWFLFCAMGMFLFLAFKSGFVRHDAHGLVSAIALLAIALLLPIIIRHRWLYPGVILILIAGGYDYYNHTGRSVGNIVNPVVNKYPVFIKGLGFRLSGKTKINRWYEAQLERVRKIHPMPLLEGTVDIYSYNQSFLLASNNHWNPRPVFQSYAAYSPELAAINESHLLSPSAPDNIIFKIEPIDKRLPALDDGLSWPALLNNYVPGKTEGGFLLLNKKNSTNTRPALVEIVNGSYALGEEVLLPDTSGLVFARIDARSNLLGRIISFLYLKIPLQINLSLNDGTQRTFRYISGMGKSGFVLSPMVENTNEFSLLFTNRDSLRNKSVRSFRIFTTENLKKLWETHFTVRLFKIME
jgi:hypothetical protein